MKVFDLCCDTNHRFEGWFGDESDFSAQQASGLLTCPLCESVKVSRLPSAPRLHLGTDALATVDPALPASKLHEQPDGFSVEMHKRLLQAFRLVLSQTQDVGPAFAAQARAMHAGEIAAAPIRGQASPEEVHSLLDEGVDVVPLPDLPWLKDTLQ